MQAIVYVDGLNLYHGLDKAGLLAYRWLDVAALASNILHPWETLQTVRYFNAPAWDREKRERQTVYNAALTASGVYVYLGRFMPKRWYCSLCHARNKRHEEKGSDVALGAHLVHDVYSLGPDVVVLVSGDGDLRGAISVVRSIPNPPRIRVAFPPKRKSVDLAKAADENMQIAETHLALLPDPVMGPSGPITKPETWYVEPPATPPA